jgi:hypothetical protein
MELRIRKIVRHLEETWTENGQRLGHPHRLAVVAAVMTNPYPPGYVEDVVTTANEIAEEIGLVIGPACVELLDDVVEAYGKFALVGIEGELEQGSALIHNLRFGNVFRDAAKGSELLPSAEKTGLPGTSIDIALKHKIDAKTRSHHQTVSFVVADAPLPREIVVGCATANGGRPLARLATFGAEAAHTLA